MNDCKLTDLRTAGEIYSWDFIQEAIKEKLARENPQPLTLDELKDRNGKPVWIMVQDCQDKNKWDLGHWALVAFFANKNTLGEMGEYCFQASVIAGRGSYLESRAIIDYGKTWVAYDNKPVGRSQDEL